MGEDEYDPPIILGRLFLNTTKAIIYIGTGEVHFHFPIGKVRRHFNDNYMIDEDPKKNKTRRRCCNRHQKNQTSKDGWADYEEEVSRYEDRYPKKEISPKEEVVQPIESAPVTVENKEEKTVRQAPSLKSTSATKQVWKVKIKLVSNSTQEEDLNH
jgi:spore germination cell wall hydrolase CwlJ-like protein